jgi:hypothetical protein
MTRILLLWRPLQHTLITRQIELLLGLILVVALGLRLWGLAFGLPNLYHPDEDALVMPAIQMIKTGDLQPIRLEYGSLQIYILAATFAVVFIQSARNGYITSVDELILYERGTYPLVYAHPEYFLAARLVSALMGTAIVLLIFMLGRRLGNVRQGLLAASLAAVLPALVTHAHLATPDTPLTLFSLLALYLLIRVYDNWGENQAWAYAGAAFVCGLAAAAKYNGIVLLVPLLLVSLLKEKSLDGLLSARVLAGPAAMAVGFLAGTPYALLNLPHFLFWTGYALRLYNTVPSGEALALSSWQWHLNYHLTSPNVLVFSLGLMGAFISGRAWGKRGLIVNSFAVVMWLAILTQSRSEARMWLPTTPHFILWTVLLIQTMVSWLLRQAGMLQRAAVAQTVVTFLLLIPLLINSARINQRFYRPDVRTHAQRWIETNIPAGSKIGVEYFAPNLDVDVWPVVREFRLSNQSMSYYQQEGFDYLVLSEAGNDPTRMSPREWEQRSTFTVQACLLASFTGPFLSAEYRSMWVYQVPPCE